MLTLKECLTMAGMSEEEAEKIVHGSGMKFILSGGLAPFVQRDREPANADHAKGKSRSRGKSISRKAKTAAASR